MGVKEEVIPSIAGTMVSANALGGVARPDKQETARTAA